MEERVDKSLLGVVSIVGLLVIIGMLVCGLVVIRVSEVEAEKARDLAEITETANVERTEERSQFWQKLVPWGDDEEEGSK